MHIPLSEARDKLDQLVLLAEAGDEVVLTRGGNAAVRLVPMVPRPSAAELDALIKSVQASVAEKLKGQPRKSGAELQDELYDEHGLPA